MGSGEDCNYGLVPGGCTVTVAASNNFCAIQVALTPVVFPGERKIQLTARSNVQWPLLLASERFPRMAIKCHLAQRFDWGMGAMKCPTCWSASLAPLDMHRLAEQTIARCAESLER